MELRVSESSWSYFSHPILTPHFNCLNQVILIKKFSRLEKNDSFSRYRCCFILTDNFNTFYSAFYINYKFLTLIKINVAKLDCTNKLNISIFYHFFFCKNQIILSNSYDYFLKASKKRKMSYFRFYFSPNRIRISYAPIIELKSNPTSN